MDEKLDRSLRHLNKDELKRVLFFVRFRRFVVWFFGPKGKTIAYPPHIHWVGGTKKTAR